MTREALDIILKLWTAEEPFDYAGKYWHVTRTDRMLESLIPHFRPYQKPHPPIGVAGVSAGSETLKLAGEHGFLPMSLNLNQSYVASHWASVEEGGRRSGRTPSRADWRLVREIFVADTDAEAWRLSVGAQMGRMMREYFLPLLKNVGVIQFLKHDEAVADSDVTPEYCARNWLIPPATVVKRSSGCTRRSAARPPAAALLDYSENPEVWRHSMELLAREVMPVRASQVVVPPALTRPL
jgi:alkanesulfonate monooxygenase SsuD/methylene tetrahydromethanopterin reductase-like flavin-dependent oxidoreductase (luciferase family)